MCLMVVHSSVEATCVGCFTALAHAFPVTRSPYAGTAPGLSAYLLLSLRRRTGDRDRDAERERERADRRSRLDRPRLREASESELESDPDPEPESSEELSERRRRSSRLLSLSFRLFLLFLSFFLLLFLSFFFLLFLSFLLLWRFLSFLLLFFRLLRLRSSSDSSSESETGFSPMADTASLLRLPCFRSLAICSASIFWDHRAKYPERDQSPVTMSPSRTNEGRGTRGGGEVCICGCITNKLAACQRLHAQTNTCPTTSPSAGTTPYLLVLPCSLLHAFLFELPKLGTNLVVEHLGQSRLTVGDAQGTSRTAVVLAWMALALTNETVGARWSAITRHAAHLYFNLTLGHGVECRSEVDKRRHNSTGARTGNFLYIAHYNAYKSNANERTSPRTPREGRLPTTMAKLLRFETCGFHAGVVGVSSLYDNS